MENRLADTFDGAVDGQICHRTEIPEKILEAINWIVAAGGNRFMCLTYSTSASGVTEFRQVLMHQQNEMVYFSKLVTTPGLGSMIRPIGKTEREELMPKRKVALVS
jgi:hypothetical protein